MAKQLNVDMRFSADTSQAKKAIQDLQNTLSNLSTLGTQASTNGFTKQIADATIEAHKLKAALNEATNMKTGTIDLSKLQQSLQKTGSSIQQVSNSLINMGPIGQKAFQEFAATIAQAQVPTLRLNSLFGELWTTLKNVARFQISSSIIHGLVGGVSSAYHYAQKLDESLNNISIVTGQNADQMARFAREANAAAKSLSSTTLDYTNASLIYYQQGLDEAAVKARTDVTVKLANVSRQSAEEVSNQMTAIWNNFDDGSKSMEYFADVITALGATTASSSQEIAAGLEKFAPIAGTIGLSYEKASAALATIVATTRQSADTVGTGLRTIFSRFDSLKLGETLEDGVDLNKYTKAMQTIGVNVLDANGKLKDMDTILDDVAQNWEKLDKTQKTAFATTVGGVRQYTNLMALFDNWDKVQENMATALNSEGVLNKQAEQYAKGWEAARNRVQTALEGLYDTLVDEEAFIKLSNALEKTISFVDNLVRGLGGVHNILGLIAAIVMKMNQGGLSNLISNVGYNIASITGIGQKQAEQMRTNIVNQAINASLPAGASAVQQAESKAMQNQLKLQQVLNKEAGKYNAIQKQVAQSLVEQQRIYDQIVIDSQKELQSLNNRLTIMKQRRSDLQAQNKTKEIKLQIKSLDQNIADLTNEIAIKEGEVNRQVKDGETSYKNIENSLRNMNTMTMSGADMFAGLIQGVTSVTMAFNMFENIVNALADSDMSFGDRLTSSLTSLLFLFPMVSSSIQSFNKIMTGSKQIVEDFAIAEELSNAISSKKITIEELKMAAEGKSSLLLQINGKRIDEETAKRIVNSGAINTETGSLVTNTAAKIKNAAASMLSSKAFKIALVAIVALVAVYKIWKKAQEERIKSAQEEAKKSAEKAKAIAEEVKANKELLKSYEEAKKAWKDGTGSKEELAEAAKKVADAYKIENSQLLIATGRYEDLEVAINKARVAEAKEAERSARYALATASQSYAATAGKNGKGYWAGYGGLYRQYQVGLGNGSTFSQIYGDESTVWQALESLEVFNDKTIQGLASIDTSTGDLVIKAEKSTAGFKAMYDFMAALVDKTQEIATLDNNLLESEWYKSAVQFLKDQEESYKAIIEAEQLLVDAKLNQTLFNVKTSDIKNLQQYNQLIDQMVESLQKDPNLKLSEEAALEYAEEYANTILPDLAERYEAAKLIKEDDLGRQKFSQWLDSISEVERKFVYNLLIDTGSEEITYDEFQKRFNDQHNKLLSTGRTAQIEDTQELLNKLFEDKLTSADLTDYYKNYINAEWLNIAEELGISYSDLRSASKGTLERYFDQIIAELQKREKEADKDLENNEEENAQEIEPPKTPEETLAIAIDKSADINQNLTTTTQDLITLLTDIFGDEKAKGIFTNLADVITKSGIKLTNEDLITWAQDIKANGFTDYGEVSNYLAEIVHKKAVEQNIDDYDNNRNFYGNQVKEVKSLSNNYSYFEPYTRAIDILDQLMEFTYTDIQEALNSGNIEKAWELTTQLNQARQDFQTSIDNIKTNFDSKAFIESLFPNINLSEELKNKLADLLGLMYNDAEQRYEFFNPETGQSYGLNFQQAFKGVLQSYTFDQDKNEFEGYQQQVTDLGRNNEFIGESGEQYTILADEVESFRLAEEALNRANKNLSNANDKNIIERFINFQEALNTYEIHKVKLDQYLSDFKGIILQTEQIVDNTIEETAVEAQEAIAETAAEAQEVIAEEAILPDNNIVENTVSEEQPIVLTKEEIAEIAANTWDSLIGKGNAFKEKYPWDEDLFDLFRRYYEQVASESDNPFVLQQFESEFQKAYDELGLDQYYTSLRNFVNDPIWKDLISSFPNNNSSIDAYYKWLLPYYENYIADNPDQFVSNYQSNSNYSNARRNSVRNNREQNDLQRQEYEAQKTNEAKEAVDEENELWNRLENQLSQRFNLDLNAIKIYGEYLKTNLNDLELSNIQLVQLAAKQTLLEKGIKSLNSEYKNFYELLEDNKGSEEFVKSLTTMQKALIELVYSDDLEKFSDIPENLFDEDFFDLNKPAIEKALQGDLTDLRKAMTSQLAKNFELPINIDIGNTEEIEQKIQTLIANAEQHDISIGASIDDTAFVNGLNEMLAAGQITVDQANQILAGMGYEPEIDYVPVEVNGATTASVSGVETVAVGGRTVQIVGNSNIGSNQEGLITLPQISAKTTYTGGKSIKPSNSGGSGGSRSTKKPAKPDRGTRYHTIKAQQSDNSRASQAAADRAERSVGKTRIDNLEQQIKLQQEAVKLQKQLLDENAEWLKIDRDEMLRQGATLGISFEFDENGVITNYQAIEDELLRMENELIDRYNAEAIDDDQFEQEKEKLDELKEAIQGYEESQDMAEEETQNLINQLDEMQDMILDLTKTKIEMGISLKEDELAYLEYQLSKLEDDAYAAAEAIALIGGRTSNKLGQASIYEQGIQEILGRHNVNSLEDLIGISPEELSTLGFTSAEQEQLNEWRDALLDINQDLIQMRKDVVDKLVDSFQSMNDEIREQQDLFEHYDSVLEHYRNIVDLNGAALGEQGRQLLKTLDQAALSNTKNQLMSAKTAYDTAIANQQQIQNAYNSLTIEEQRQAYKPVLDAANEAAREAQEEWLTIWEENLQRAAEILEREAQEATDAYLKPLDYFNEAYGRQKELDDLYQPEFERLHNLNKLSRDLNNAIDDTDSIQGKKNLIALQQRINKLMEAGNKLSDYDIEALEKEIALEKARIALEDAQNAKSQVRLQRDNEGNWGYVYTADEKAVAEAEQAYEDTLYEYQKLNDDYIRDLQDQLLELRRNMGEQLKEIWADTTLTEAEKQQRSKELTDYYNSMAESLQQQAENAFNAQSGTLELYKNKYGEFATELADTFGETLIGRMLGGEVTLDQYFRDSADAIGELVTQLQIADQNWQQNNEDIDATAGVPLADIFGHVGEVIQDVGNQSDTTTQAIEDLSSTIIDNFSEAIMAAMEFEEEQAAKIDEQILKTEQWIEALNALNVMLHAVGSENTDFNNQFASWSMARGQYSRGEITKEQWDKINNDMLALLTSGGPVAFDTGGYTGAWGDNAKLALLHEKEQVFNAKDTENLLEMAEVLRELDAQAILHKYSSILTSMVNPFSGGLVVDQNVHITAEFPNVTDHNEIEEALNNLVMRASQYVNRK